MIVEFTVLDFLAVLDNLFFIPTSKYFVVCVCKIPEDTIYRRRTHLYLCPLLALPEYDRTTGQTCQYPWNLRNIFWSRTFRYKRAGRGPAWVTGLYKYSMCILSEFVDRLASANPTVYLQENSKQGGCANDMSPLYLKPGVYGGIERQ